jgi:hypothetical protein
MQSKTLLFYFLVPKRQQLPPVSEELEPGLLPSFLLQRNNPGIMVVFHKQTNEQQGLTFQQALEARFGPNYHYFEATPSKEQLDKMVAKIRGTVDDSDVTCDDSDVTSETVTTTSSTGRQSVRIWLRLGGRWIGGGARSS